MFLIYLMIHITSYYLISLRRFKLNLIVNIFITNIGDKGHFSQNMFKLDSVQTIHVLFF
jgi:hypothetical protein